MHSWDFKEGDTIVTGRTAVRLLGGGHRYEAYLAWDEALHALVVVKVVRPELVEDPRTLVGLSGEVEALETLAHPMLVRSFAAGVGGRCPHVVLEFVEGPRLSTLLRRYGSSLEQLLPLAVNVCSALHYMHGRGWVHLDVKPRNLIMGASPRLIDLSVARPAGCLHRLQSPVGTVGYMAPEQSDPRRFGELGPAADIWGLGATLHEALGGGIPGLAPGLLPERVPHAVREVVEACLAPAPRERPAAADVAAALEPLAAALPRPRLGPLRPGGRQRMRELDLR